jgi:hypothetical protein
MEAPLIKLGCMVYWDGSHDEHLGPIGIITAMKEDGFISITWLRNSSVIDYYEEDIEKYCINIVTVNDLPKK